MSALTLVMVCVDGIVVVAAGVVTLAPASLALSDRTGERRQIVGKELVMLVDRRLVVGTVLIVCCSFASWRVLLNVSHYTAQYHWNHLPTKPGFS